MSLTTEQIANAITKKAGNITEAARALKVSREHLSRVVNGDESLQQLLKQQREALVDIAESALLKQIKRGNIAAIIFTLKTQGKARGYVERTEISGPNEGPIETKHVHELSDDELARIAASSGGRASKTETGAA